MSSGWRIVWKQHDDKGEWKQITTNDKEDEHFEQAAIRLTELANGGPVYVIGAQKCLKVISKGCV